MPRPAGLRSSPDTVTRAEQDGPNNTIKIKTSLAIQSSVTVSAVRTKLCLSGIACYARIRSRRRDFQRSLCELPDREDDAKNDSRVHEDLEDTAAFFFGAH